MYQCFLLSIQLERLQNVLSANTALIEWLRWTKGPLHQAGALMRIEMKTTEAWKWIPLAIAPSYLFISWVGGCFYDLHLRPADRQLKGIVGKGPFEIKAEADSRGFSLFSPVNSLRCCFLFFHSSEHCLGMFIGLDYWLSATSLWCFVLRRVTHGKEREPIFLKKQHFSSILEDQTLQQLDLCTKAFWLTSPSLCQVCPEGHCKTVQEIKIKEMDAKERRNRGCEKVPHGNQVFDVFGSSL